MIFFTPILCACVLFSFWPRPFPEPGTQAHVMPSRPLIGPFGTREQIDDVSYANESRDPLKQYPKNQNHYCHTDNQLHKSCDSQTCYMYLIMGINRGEKQCITVY